MPLAMSPDAHHQYQGLLAPAKLYGDRDGCPYPWYGSPERGCRFLGEIRASCQHDLQRAKSAHIMAVELRVLLDPAKQMSEINLALAWGQMFFVASMAVGESDLLAAG